MVLLSRGLQTGSPDIFYEILGFLTVSKNIVKYRLNMTNFANFYHYFIPKLKKINMYHVNSDIIQHF